MKLVNTNTAPVFNKSFLMNNIKIIKTLTLLIFGSTLWFLYKPPGITVEGWHLLIIFILIILSMVSKILPTGSLAIICMSLCCATRTLSLENTIGTFGSKIVWLVFSAFILARGFTKTGLGARVGYYFVYLFGKNTIGLSYSLIATETFLAPFIPSNTARGAGIIFPIASAISKEYKSNELSGFIMKICFHANVITSAMFMTASAANPLITSISRTFNYELSWIIWFKTAILPCLISLLILPFLLLLFFPQAFQHTPEIQVFAKQQIKKNGPLSKDEWIMLFTFLLLLCMWAAGSFFNLDATVSAFIGLSILLITKILTWDDIVSEKEAWNTFMWLATLLMLAGNLAKLGVIDWMSNEIHARIVNLNWLNGVLWMSIIYFLGHYLLASITSHVSALYAAFCSTAILLGAPPGLTVLLFAGISNFSSCITHYTTGSGPLFFSSNYVSMQKWWKAGIVIGIINSAIWIIVGGWWWKVLKVW